MNKENSLYINKELINMRIANIIKDEDEMKYIFPARDVYLDIKREDSNIPVPNGANYIITIGVYGIYGNKMFDIKTDEINMARIVDCINYFNSELGGYGDSMDIEISPSDSTNFEFIYLSLTRLPGISQSEKLYSNGQEQYNPYVQDTMDIFDIKFEIKKYSKLYETLNVMYTTTLNTSSLDDLSYSLFFVSLIDLDPAYYSNSIEYDYMYDNTNNIDSYSDSKSIDFDSLDQSMERVLSNRYNTLNQRILNSNVKVNTYNNPNLNY
jgi:hypothetical protein